MSILRYNLLPYYTKKVEEKSPSSTFPRGEQSKIYLKQHRQSIKNWMRLSIFKPLQHNQLIYGLEILVNKISY